MQGNPQRALRLVGAAATVREQIHAPLAPSEKLKLDQMLEPLKPSLAEPEWSALYAQGQATALDQAIDYALSEG